MSLQDDPQVLMTTAEVMTVPLVAAIFFGDNIEHSRRFLAEYGYMKTMLSKSRLNRRLHAIDDGLWEGLFAVLAELFKECNTGGAYVVDSLPVAVCDNIRIRRCKLYPQDQEGENFRGYVPSKRRYFYGLRVHLVVSGSGEPVEFCLAAASESDTAAFKRMNL